MKTITIIGCCVSDMINSAMITEYWTPQSSHRNTFFPMYLVKGITCSMYMYFQVEQLLVRVATRCSLTASL